MANTTTSDLDTPRTVTLSMTPRTGADVLKIIQDMQRIKGGQMNVMTYNALTEIYKQIDLQTQQEIGT